METPYTKIGKLSGVKFGMGGYQDAMIGFTFYLETKGGSSVDFWGYWSHTPQSREWTDDSRFVALGKQVMRVNELMKQAKVTNFEDLEGVPIEVTWDSVGRLQSWRILEEVI